MKIVQINSVCGYGSTGRIAVEIAEAAEKRGHICYIAYGYGDTTYHRAHKIGNRVEHLFHNVFFSRLLGLHGYGSIFTTWLFTRWLDKIQPDVVHIHNLHANYLNLIILYKYLIKRKINVVYTLHDCYHFTGKCTYYTSANCSKYISGCKKCAYYNKQGFPSLFFDFSSKIWRRKKLLYSQLESCEVIAVSKWLQGDARKSILATNRHRVSYIYNWVDHSVFKPASEEEMDEFREKYGLLKDKKYLISVSQEWNKNTIRYRDAEILSQKLPEGYKLILVGKLANGTIIDPLIKHIPYITDRHELSVAFSLADAYVHFSLEDTFGLVIAEAMACGTIPITYDSTACAEVPGVYGIIVKPRNVDDVIHSLVLLDEKIKQRAKMVEYVKKNYDKNINTNKYVDIYESFKK